MNLITRTTNLFRREPPVTTSKNGERLSKYEERIFRTAKCPDCMSTHGIGEGPHGGGSINYYCLNTEACGSRFNDMGPFGVDRISDASPRRKTVQ